MFDHDPLPRRFSQRTTLPVWPDSVIVPVGEPRQMGVFPPLTLPPTVAGFTTIDREDE
jgi:hypothetical protein